MDILRNAWYFAATSDEVSAKPLGRTICGEPVVLFRDAVERVGAIDGVCAHRQAPLALGRIVDGCIECPYHGMRFRSDGQCVSIPTQATIPKRAHLRSYPIVERWNAIWIWTGNPAFADSSKIPAMPWVDDAEWNSDIVHYHHVSANYMLMVENLLDLSHVAYVHSNTIGFNPQNLENDPLVVEVGDDYVRNTRVMQDVEPSPVTRMWGDFKGLVERTSISEWRPPSIEMIFLRHVNKTLDQCQRIDHFVTPETERTHHYWIRVSRNFSIDDASVTERMYKADEQVIEEDFRIVVAQQHIRDKFHRQEGVAIAQDKGIVAAHRILNKLLGQERACADEVSAS